MGLLGKDLFSIEENNKTFLDNSGDRRCVAIAMVK